MARPTLKVLWVLGVWGCTSAPNLPLRVEAAGCAAVSLGPRCEVAAGAELVLWVPLTGTEIPTLWQDSVRLSVAPETDAMGHRFAVSPPASARELRVQSGNRRFALALLPHTPEPALVKARELRGTGEIDAAEAVVRLALPKLGTDSAGRARSLLARLQLSRGNVDEAISGLTQSLAGHRAHGRASDAFLDAQALSYLFTHERVNFAAAREVLQGLEAYEEVDAENAAASRYYRALVESESAHGLAAVQLFREAEARAERLNLDRQRRVTLQAKSVLLTALGRHAEALESLQSLEQNASLTACERAMLLNNLAWTTMASQPNADVMPWLFEARRLFLGDCKNPSELSNVAVNIALAHLSVGRPQEARGSLEALGATLAPRLSVWALDIQGRSYLMEREWERADAFFARLGALADAVALDGARWRASVGQARAALGRGKRVQAIAHLFAAERWLEQEVARAPLTEGRESLLADKEAAASLLVTVLMELDRPDDALAAARRSRGRFLRTLQQLERASALRGDALARFDGLLQQYQVQRRALNAEAEGDWRLSLDKLGKQRRLRQSRAQAVREHLDGLLALLPLHSSEGRSRAPGEVVLTYHPGEKGWWGFAEGEGGVVARALGPVVDTSPAKLAEALLRPFAKSLESASRVVFMPSGALREVDFHALPWGEEPLFASKEVVYALDLPSSADAPSGVRRALVVGDPNEDLPHARAEASEVARALRDQGAEVTLTLGRNVRGPAVLDELPKVQLFHFAGHGQFEGWSSALRLGDGPLELGDVLTLARAPDWVVLSGCETARASAEQLGLAQAFLVAGASTAVASSRKVRDEGAKAFTSALYRIQDRTPFQEVSSRVRSALLHLREAGHDWSAYRIWVR